MSYDKKQEGLVQHGRILTGARKTYFEEPVNEHGKVVLYSRKVRTPSNWKNLTRVYKAILEEYDEFDICSILTGSGYKYYLDLKPGKYHHLCYSLMLMYHLGTVPAP